jgi:chaperonin GroEL
LEKPYILLTNYRLQKANELLPIMEQIHRQGQQRGLVVIAHAIKGDALNLLVTNKVRNIMPTLGIRTPGAGLDRNEILQDLAAVCGGRVLVEERGDRLEAAGLADLGQADEVQAIRSGFTLTGGKGRPAVVRQRIQEIRGLMVTAAPGRERDRLGERAGKLIGGVALLYVGGATDVERDYLKERAKEAVRAVRLGLTEGIAPGGGTAFLDCLPALEALCLPADEAVVIPLLREALLAPMQMIIQNSGYEARPIIAQVQQRGPGYGFDVERGEIVPMLETHIIDPVQVLAVALKTAISGAIMTLTTETLVHKPRFNRDREVDLKP